MILFFQTTHKEKNRETRERKSINKQTQTYSKLTMDFSTLPKMDYSTPKEELLKQNLMLLSKLQTNGLAKEADIQKAQRENEKLKAEIERLQAENKQLKVKVCWLEDGVSYKEKYKKELKEAEAKLAELKKQVSSIAEEYLSTGDETLDEIREYIEAKTDEVVELKALCDENDIEY